MTRARTAWITGAALIFIGAVYQTLGVFKDFERETAIPVLHSGATAPELFVVSEDSLFTGAQVLLALILMVTLPAVGEAHIVTRMGSYVRAILLPLRASARPTLLGAGLWSVIVAGMVSPAVWSDSWHRVEPVSFLSDARSPTVVQDMSPLGMFALTVLNLAVVFCVLGLWTGLATLLLPSKYVRMGLLAFVLIGMLSSIWTDLLPIGSWVGERGVMRQFPAGLSSTAVIAAVGLVPVAVAMILDLRRTARIALRRVVALAVVLVVAYQAGHLGFAYDTSARLSDALTFTLGGYRVGLGENISVVGMVSIQAYALVPALLVVGRIEEQIHLWPMLRVRGGGTTRWLSTLCRGALGWSVLVTALPVAGGLVAALGRPAVFAHLDGSDLTAVAYWMVVGTLQGTLNAAILALVRLATSSAPMWVAACAVLLALPLVVGTRWVPAGLQHLILLDTYGPTALLSSVLVLCGSLAIVLTAGGALLSRRSLVPEV